MKVEAVVDARTRGFRGIGRPQMSGESWGPFRRRRLVVKGEVGALTERLCQKPVRRDTSRKRTVEWRTK